jgi:hypothetical protein
MESMQAAIALATQTRLGAMAAGVLPAALVAAAKLLDQSMRRPSLVGMLAHSLHLAL